MEGGASLGLVKLWVLLTGSSEHLPKKGLAWGPGKWRWAGREGGVLEL